MWDWLVDAGVQVAAMERRRLGSPRFTAWSGALKAVAGRKSDVRDAGWIAQLLELGLWRRRSYPHRRSADCGC